MKKKKKIFKTKWDIAEYYWQGLKSGILHEMDKTGIKIFKQIKKSKRKG